MKKVMHRALLAAVLLLVGLVAASPALALGCYGPEAVDNSFSFSTRGSDRFGGTQELQNLQNVMRLRQSGIDATAVESWNGCLRVYVKNENGPGEHMEFYMPGSLRRVQ